MLNILKRGQIGICHGLLAVMVGALFFQVIAREFNLGVDWTEEISRFAFISLVFISASYATLMDSHLKISVFSDMLVKLIGKKPVFIIHAFFLLAFDFTMVYFCSINVIEGIRYPNVSPALGFNQNYLFAVLVIGFLMSAIIRIIYLVDALFLRRAAAEGES